MNTKNILRILPYMFLFCISMSRCEQQKAAIVPAKSNKKICSIKQRSLKKYINVASGVAAGIAVHIVSEFFSVLTHEFGHAVANDITGGSSGDIVLYHPSYSTPIEIFHPFNGRADFKTSGNAFVLVAAGPISGLIASTMFLGAAEGERASLDGKPVVDGIKKGIAKPVTIYGQISDYVKRLLTDKNMQAPSFKDTFFATFETLKSGSILCDFLYGLTPLRIKVKMDGQYVDGDGPRIWRNLGVKQNVEMSPLSFFGVVAAPICLAALHGAYKACIGKSKKVGSRKFNVSRVHMVKG